MKSEYVMSVQLKFAFETVNLAYTIWKTYASGTSYSVNRITVIQAIEIIYKITVRIYKVFLHNLLRQLLFVCKMFCID